MAPAPSRRTMRNLSASSVPGARGGGSVTSCSWAGYLRARAVAILVKDPLGVDERDVGIAGLIAANREHVADREVLLGIGRRNVVAPLGIVAPAPERLVGGLERAGRVPVLQHRHPLDAPERRPRVRAHL